MKHTLEVLIGTLFLLKKYRKFYYPYLKLILQQQLDKTQSQIIYPFDLHKQSIKLYLKQQKKKNLISRLKRKTQKGEREKVVNTLNPSSSEIDSSGI